MAAIDIDHVPGESHFELVEDGVLIGQARYREVDGRRVFTHTEVSPDHQGQGLATRLIVTALSATRDDGFRIVARCPMVAAYVAKHHDYDDVLDAS